MQIGVRIPDFCPLFNDEAVNEFLGRVPGPWLVKPRSEASASRAPLRPKGPSTP